MKNIFIKRWMICLITIVLMTTNIAHIVLSVNFKERKSDENFNIKINEKSVSIISFNINFNEPSLIKQNIDNETYFSISLRNLTNYAKPGEPLLPIKSIKVLLPFRNEIKKIQAEGEKINLQGKYTIMPAGRVSNQETINDNSNIYKNKKIYCSLQAIPGKLFEIADVGFQRGFTIVTLNIFPVQYCPQEKKLSYYNEINICIETKEASGNKLYRGLEKDKEIIQQSVINPIILNTYPLLDDPIQEFEYVIITSDALENTFQHLLQYKSQYLTANIVNLSFIENDFTGVDLQEKIRNFIIYAYLNWGTDYILLGGDAEIVPYRGLWGCVYDESSHIWYNRTSIPSDLYFAGLDDTWDADFDGIFGEDVDHSITDEADFLAEVFVGRVPVKTEKEVDNFIYKLIKFEASFKPKAVILHQSRLAHYNIPDSRAIPENCSKWIPEEECNITRLYEENEKITLSKWVNCFTKSYLLLNLFSDLEKINKPWPLIILHTGHGEYDNYCLHDSNFNSTCTWFGINVVGLKGIEKEIFDIFPVHISVSCHTGNFSYDKCLGEWFLLTENAGASACILYSDLSWFASDNAHKYSGEFAEKMFYQLFQNETERLGEINQYAKQDMIKFAANDTTYRWCYYAINLLGDPETPILTKRGKSIEIEKVTGRFLRVTSDIKNTGEQPMNNIIWIIGYAKFFPGISGADTDGIISNIGPGDTHEISTLQGTKTMLLFGISSIRMFIWARTTDSNTIWTVTKGIIFGPFVRIYN